MEEEKESQELTAVGNPTEKETVDNGNDGANGGGAGGMLFYFASLSGDR